MIDYFEKSILFLIDELPGLDKNSALEIVCLLENNGYIVKCQTVEELKSLYNPYGREGFLLVIPNCGNLPVSFSTWLETYVTYGGKLLLLGGPLFYNYVEKDANGQYITKPLVNMVDATFAVDHPPFVIAGVTPSYKVYPVKNITQFIKDESQNIFDGEIKTKSTVDIICPCGRIYGKGYNNQHNHRFIPIVNAVSDCNDGDVMRTGRANGRKGAVAYIVLSETKEGGYRGKNKIGTIDNTCIGSCVAAIGIKNQDILSVSGMDKLILSIIDSFKKSIFLFEGGTHGFRFQPDDKIIIGCRVLNNSIEFKKVNVRFTFHEDGKYLYSKESELLCAPKDITDFSCETDYKSDSGKDITVTTELIVNQEIIDFIQHEFSVLSKTVRNKSEFVSVMNGNFYCNGKQTYLAAINYWPSYYPSLETADYWRGFCDCSNYDPQVIEEDLDYMEKIGLNCLMTRIDGYNHARVKHGLADFLLRCERHNIKVSLSYTNVTTPSNYSSDAFKRLIAENDIAENPTVLCHDIEWESGPDYMATHIRKNIDDEWHKWVIERYNSIENAISDWGYEPEYNELGYIMSPKDEQFENEGIHRIMVSAYRRFLDDYISRLYNDAITDMKKYDDNHLFTFRHGVSHSRTTAFTATVKHTDFICPEGYGVSGYDMACFMVACFRLLSPNKPILWAEFGKSLCGTKWDTLYWDHENYEYYESEKAEQLSYIETFLKIIERTNVNGSAPWWWCGGFRLSEMADFGFNSPDGMMRPCGISYIDFVKKMNDKVRNQCNPKKIFLIDRDEYIGGYHEISKNIGKDIFHEVDSCGMDLEIMTVATGTDSTNVPLMAVGNTKYTGNNPPKYLNAEFNFVKIDVNGKEYVLNNGGTVIIPQNCQAKLKASVGNLQEAMWIAPNDDFKTGMVYLVSTDNSQVSIKLPIEKNVPYLADAIICGEIVLADKEDVFVELNMLSENRAQFGEKFRFHIRIAP